MVVAYAYSSVIRLSSLQKQMKIEMVVKMKDEFQMFYCIVQFRFFQPGLHNSRFSNSKAG